jgi:hypothetical protein
MAYTPNPDDATQPTDNTDSETAQAEFRAIKTKLQTLAAAVVTWNTADKSTALTLSAGNLIVTNNLDGTQQRMVRCTVGKTTGSWYWEVTISTIGANTVSVGIAKLSENVDQVLGYGAAGFAYRSDGQKVTGNVAAAYGATFTTGDIIGVALNCTTGSVTFYKNGVSQGVAFTVVIGSYALYPAVSMQDTTATLQANFGATAFAESLPGSYIGLGAGAVTAYTGSRNRLINSACVIDQYNSGAAQTPVVNGAFIVDRWYYKGSVAGKFNSQQSLGAATPPAGFIKYAGLQVAVPYIPGAGESFYTGQKIEGFNVGDFNWGSAAAQTVTLLFQVWSSVTGLHSGVIKNSALNRSYSFTFTVSAASSWTPVAIIIPGDTAGVWLTDTGVGVEVLFNLGCSVGLQTAPGVWTAADSYGATGCVTVVSGVAGTSFYITGCELRDGLWTASSVPEVENISKTIVRCQRYYAAVHLTFGDTKAVNGQVGFAGVWPVTMRAIPVIVATGSPSATTFYTTGYSVTLDNNGGHSAYTITSAYAEY